MTGGGPPLGGDQGPTDPTFGGPIPAPTEQIPTPPPVEQSFQRRYQPGQAEGRSPSTGRSIGAGFILTLASWLLVSGMAGLWLRATLLDPNGFATVVSQVIEGSSELQDQIGEELLPAGGDRGQAGRDKAQVALEEVLSTGEADSILQEQLIALHTAIFDPNAEGTSVDLSGLIEPVQAKLDEEGVNYQIPTDRLSEIEVGFNGILQPVRSAAGLARTATLLMPILGIILVGVGLLVSDRRLRSLRWLGWNVAVSAGVIAIFSILSRSVMGAAMDYGGIQGTGMDAAWSSMSQGLVTRMGVLAIVAAIVAIAAWIAAKRIDA